MGQYHRPCNLTTNEYLHPHDFGDGLKLLEFGESGQGTMSALILLLAPGGRWHGDRIAIVGDYAEDADLPGEFMAGTIWERCTADEADWQQVLDWRLPQAEEGKYGWDMERYEAMVAAPRYTNVSDIGVGQLIHHGVVYSTGQWGQIENERPGGAESWAPSDEVPMVIQNLTRRQYLRPEAFGDTPTLDRFIWAYGESVLCAFAVLLACACKGGARGGGDFHGDQEGIVGSWASDQIAVIPAAQAVGMDVSLIVRGLMAQAESSSQETDYIDHEDGTTTRIGWGGQKEQAA